MTSLFPVQASPGDLWVLGGPFGSGKSGVCQILSLELAKAAMTRNSGARTLCWNAEMPAVLWKQRMFKIDAEASRYNLDYTCESWPTPSSPGPSLAEFLSSRRVVTIDGLDILVANPTHDSAALEEALRMLKYTAVRCGCIVVVTLQANATELDGRGDFLPDSLRAQMWKRYADRVFTTTCSNGRLVVRESGRALAAFSWAQDHFVPASL